jgi:hypothetical protein
LYFGSTCTGQPKFQFSSIWYQYYCSMSTEASTGTVVPPITRSPNCVGSDNEDLANGYNKVSHPTVSNFSNEVIIQQQGILRPCCSMCIVQPRCRVFHSNFLASRVEVKMSSVSMETSGVPCIPGFPLEFCWNFEKKKKTGQIWCVLKEMHFTR